MKRFLIVLMTIVGVTFSGIMPVEAKRTIGVDGLFCTQVLNADICQYLYERVEKFEPPVVYPPNLDEVNEQGYYAMPDSLDGAYEKITYPYGWCGSRELIGVLYTAIQDFHEVYPDVVIKIGELNAPGHIEHKRGVTADIAGWHGNAQAVELGKALLDTGRINYIIHRDRSVNAELETYAQDIGETDVMRYKWDHPHFHVRIDSEFEGVRSTKCGRDW
ncbi:MAG: hypothetical protein R3251_00795 [Candidatus Spechtbacterales bacterium]|nr:hypothetical protein [Candidatus Spechtbacterales bacterium]